MTTYLFTTSLHSVTGLPADDCDIDIVTVGVDPVTTFAAIRAFFNVTQASGFEVGQYISPMIKRVGSATMKAYDLTGHLDGSAHGSPTDEDTFDIDAPLVTASLPSEVALVVSLHADLTGISEESGATRPRARRRGRFYVGPLNTDTVTPGAAVDVPNGTFFDTVYDASAALLADLSGALSVWSRKDATTRVVVGGWLDNAWDTQRRRGEAATTRSVFP